MLRENRFFELAVTVVESTVGITLIKFLFIKLMVQLSLIIDADWAVIPQKKGNHSVDISTTTASLFLSY